MIQFVSHVKNQNLVAVSVKTLQVKYSFKKESRLNTYLDISFLIEKIKEKSVTSFSYWLHCAQNYLLFLLGKVPIGRILKLLEYALKSDQQGLSCSILLQVKSADNFALSVRSVWAGFLAFYHVFMPFSLSHVQKSMAFLRAMKETEQERD